MRLVRELREIRREYNKTYSFIALENAIIILLISAIFLRFMNFNIFIAIIPPILYLLYIIFLCKSIREKHIVEKIASVDPSLSERIKTAYDNRKYRGRNIVLISLNYDVSRMMDKMGLSSLIDIKMITFRTITTVILAFILLSINFINLDFTRLSINLNPDYINEITNSISKSHGFNMGRDMKNMGNLNRYVADNRYKDKEERQNLGAEGGGEIPGFSEGEIPDTGGGAGLSADEDIFGKATSAKIEGKNIDMKLHPEYGGNIEIRDVNQVSDINILDIGEVKATEMPEQEPLEYREFIKRYFQSLQREMKNR